MYKQLLLILALSISVSSIAQIVNIPDANFKACLVANSGLNTNGDAEIQVSEAQSYTGSISCSSQNIADITGIAAFTNLLNGIGLSGNPINGAVDLTNSPNLRFVDLENSGITSVNLIGLNQLENLNLQFNEVNNFDVSSLSSLETLTIGYNPLTSLTFGAANTAFVSLNADEITMMPILDLSPLPSLENILMQNCEFDEIILPSTTTFTSINLFGSDVLEIDPSVATNLVTFSNPGNDAITSLDLSANTMLDVVSVSGSDTLTELILASGNNDNITTFFAGNTTALDCIEVDVTIDLNNPPAGWNADPNDIYSYDCSGVAAIVNIPDANFKACLLATTTIDTNQDGEVQVTEADAFTGSILCENMAIVSVTGLEAFSGITDLRLDGNGISNIDLTGNIVLGLASLVGNPITTIDTSQNSELTNLNITNTNIQFIDLSSNLELRTLRTVNAPLNSISLSVNTQLDRVSIGNTNITELDVSTLPALRFLSFYNTDVSIIDVSNNTLLEGFSAYNCQLVDVDLSINANLEEVEVNDNALETLDISNGNNAILDILRAEGNPDLECIQVDDTIDLNNPPADWEKDAAAEYSYDCMFLAMDNFEVNTIALFPNPATNFVIIESEIAITQIEVYTVFGKKIDTPSSNSINLSSYVAGMYLLKISTEQGSIIKKVIKQ